MAKKAKKQTVLFIVASVADLLATLWGTAQVGYGAELNPIARGILVAGGPLGLSAYKLGGVIFVLVLLTWLTRLDDRAWVKLIAKFSLLLGALLAAAGAWSWLPVLTSVY